MAVQDALFQPTFPPVPLPAPTPGPGFVPCTFTLAGAATATIQVWRRRTRQVSLPLLLQGGIPRAHLDGSPFPTVDMVLVEAGEVVVLGSGAGGAYTTAAEDLTASVASSLPWIGWTIPKTAPPLPVGARITISGGMLQGAVDLVLAPDGTPQWTRPGGPGSSGNL